MASNIILVDGSQSFDGGVDSNKVTTLKDNFVPNGLERNELAWLINARVRDGGITCRDGWYYRGEVSDGLSLFQGGHIYEPLGANPYLVALIGGVTYKVDLDTYAVTDLTGGNAALLMDATQPQAFFCQAENYLVIQDGSYSTLPLFWNGTTLSRSLGITNTAVAPGTNGVNEIPAAGPMDYYMGRLWYVNGARQYSAGDIVGGNSGTAGQGFKDAVLNVTENPLVVGGDGFTVPTSAGAIRALKHSANINTSLGQGLLFIFTRKQIYSLDVPITRSDWISSTSSNQPVQKVVQFVNGAVSDRSIVAVNGDLFYQALEPSIRSLLLAIRYYTQWGNTAISANEDRILQFNDRALMWASSGIVFNNRLLMTALPKQGTCGVYHQALIPLDFDPVSSFQHQDNPIWEGHYEGLDMLQLFAADFGGHERAFTLAISRLTGAIQLWELTDSERFDTTTVEAKRITWITETPAYTFSMAHKLKQLLGGEVWLDRAYGTVTVKVYYRVDADPCWLHWHTHEFCVAKSTCEDVLNPICYPVTNYAEGYKWPIVLPAPPKPCDSMHIRPSNIGYQFQVKVEVSGWARIRSIFVYANEQPHGIYQGLRVQDSPPNRQALPTL